ncbi:hypothetical protein PInf_003613 [Phytophthora infestans]|nr:hypothetical protein PInf_003613 [Phytophthora infestans]
MTNVLVCVDEWIQRLVSFLLGFKTTGCQGLSKPNIVNVNFQLVAARKTHKTTGVPAFPSMQGVSKETETDFATYKAMTSEVTLTPAIEETGLVENSTKLTD